MTPEDSRTIGDVFSGAIDRIFGPALHAFFDPINAFLGRIYEPWATLLALSLFIGTMIWVFILRKEYVNVDAPGKAFYHDLRFWTIVSMLPHVLVYLYFAKWS